MAVNGHDGKSKLYACRLGYTATNSEVRAGGLTTRKNHMMRAEALLNFGYMDVVEVVVKDFQRAYQDQYLADMSENMSVFSLTPEVWSDTYYQEKYGIEFFQRKVLVSFKLAEDPTPAPAEGSLSPNCTAGQSGSCPCHK